MSEPKKALSISIYLLFVNKKLDEALTLTRSIIVTIVPFVHIFVMSGRSGVLVLLGVKNLLALGLLSVTVSVVALN